MKPPTTLARNLRRRSDAVLDQPLVDKIHSPPTNFTSPWFFGHPSSLFSKTPTLRRCISPSIDADPRTAGCPWCDLGPFPSFSPFRYVRVSLVRHTTVNRIWISPLRLLCSLPHEPDLCFYPSSKPLARIHITEVMQHICRNQNRILG